MRNMKILAIKSKPNPVTKEADHCAVHLFQVYLRKIQGKLRKVQVDFRKIQVKLRKVQVDLRIFRVNLRIFLVNLRIFHFNCYSLLTVSFANGKNGKDGNKERLEMLGNTKKCQPNLVLQMIQRMNVRARP